MHKFASFCSTFSNHCASDYGLHSRIAAQVTKVGGGSPGRDAIRVLLERIDSDPAWFPGKSYQQSFGPAPAMSKTNQHVVAKSLMKAKEEGIEPTYAVALARCPRATVNPHTQRPVGKKRIYDIMTEYCYDKDPKEPWAHRARLTKTALTPEMVLKRLAWAKQMTRGIHKAGWYYRNVIWIDLCNNILPKTQAKATEQALARKGRKGWVSNGAQTFSRNLRGKTETLKQNYWDTERVWWAPCLVRGKVHVEVLPEGFPGECPEGVAILVQRLPAMLQTRFPDAGKPRYVMTDRGRGFFNPGTGAITAEYEGALEQNGLRALQGHSAATQPGSLSEVLLHETAAAWLRHLLSQSTPAEAWKETRAAFAARLREQCRWINSHYDVDGLCREFPHRVAKLVARKGDKLEE